MTGSINSALLALYQQEIRELTDCLNQGLVSLEHTNSPTVLDSLMRAAHSVKGASRAVGLGIPEKIAHEMEELLVKAQKSNLPLDSAAIDILLKATDLVSQSAGAFGNDFAAWTQANQNIVDELLKQLERKHQEPSATPNIQPGGKSPPIEFETPPIEWDMPPQDPVFLAVFQDELKSCLNHLQNTLNTEPANISKLSENLKSIQGAALLVQFTPLCQVISLALMRLEKTSDFSFLNSLAGHLEQLSQEQPDKLHEFFQKQRPLFESLLFSTPSKPILKPTSVLTQNNPASGLSGAHKSQSVILHTGGNQEPRDSVVRVTAQSLTRLMGLAGESLVEARWLAPFSQSLLKLKREQDRLLDQMDDLVQNLDDKFARNHKTTVLDIRENLHLAIKELNFRVQDFENHARRSDDLNSRLYNEVITSRMRPFGDGTHSFARMVRDLGKDLGKKVRLELVGESTPVDRDVLDKLEAPLTHLLRNAVDHGLEDPATRVQSGKQETGTVRIEVKHHSGMLSILVSDDGAGIDTARIKEEIRKRQLSTPEMISQMTEHEILDFLFLPGFSTKEQVTEVSGRGVGLDVLHSMVTAVGGAVRVTSNPSRGTTFHLHLPLTLSVIRAVLVEIAGETYAFPHNRIERLFKLSRDQIHFLEHRQYFQLNGENIGLLMASQVFRTTAQVASGDLFVVLFRDNHDLFGLVVDSFRGEQDLVVRALDARLGKVPNISAAAILDDGAPVLIVDVDDIRRSIEKILEEDHLEQSSDIAHAPFASKKRVLIVDDSITVREVEKQLLLARGYEVTLAVDGMDGWNALREKTVDLVVTDIDMPRMNGLDFTTKIKQDSKFSKIPVIIVSHKDREEDKFRGLEAGANYYLTKSSFHDESLALAIEKLIGKA